MPGTLLAIGDSYARAGRWGDAQSFYAEATRRFPYAAAGLGGSGARAARRGAPAGLVGRDLPGAGAVPGRPGNPGGDGRGPVHHLAGAGQPARAARRATGALADGGARPDPFTRAEAQAYAGCRQSFRRYPDLRRRLAGREIPPGRWSPAEESACTALWLRAYLAHRGQGREADAGLDDLIEVAREGLMDERALHDVAGLADPRLLWLIDEGRRTRLFEFVERHRVMPRQDVGVLSPF